MNNYIIIDILRHKMLSFSVKDKVLQSQEHIIVKNTKEEFVAKIIRAEETPSIKEQDSTSNNFIRILTPEERRGFYELQQNEKARILIAQDLSLNLKLEMRFFASKVGWQNKVTSFFFVSQDPIDFRELLKLLIKHFQGRIHLERVGARDRAKILGGYGSCGRETCCSSFKINLESVPMDSVRDQGIMMKDNAKVLGLCGKLKCCLLYELPYYRKIRQYLPHIRESVVLKNKKKGMVIGIDILNQKVKILLEGGGHEFFSVTELKGR